MQFIDYKFSKEQVKKLVELDLGANRAGYWSQYVVSTNCIVSLKMVFLFKLWHLFLVYSLLGSV